MLPDTADRPGANPLSDHLLTDPVHTDPGATLASLMEHDGYAFVKGDQTRTLLTDHGTLADWEQFAASWGTLELDTYMGDGGRYRRRRPRGVPRRGRRGDDHSRTPISRITRGSTTTS